ncbi:MAG TPA: 4-hydroxy-tetrahydrodipicolinate synthase [Actinomycetes bacterium]|nr:4-hydroxy-tetrahydrodipicolinate synthase [Actinomycetes bacterium]
MTSSAGRPAPFGRVLTAMVTPFRDDLSVDLDAVGRLATHLVESGNDGLVVNGTTGESPTTTDVEQQQVVQAVVDAVGDRALVVAGASSNDTVHAIERARLAEIGGADALLVVSPYYNRPPQAGVLRHVTMVADSTDLPVMLYDIPGRTGVAIDTDTLVRAAEHERILAVKDAKGDLSAASWVMRRSNLAWYSGEDVLNLPLLSIGGVGVVSVAGHVVAERLLQMLNAFEAGEVARARDLHDALLPVYTGIFRTQGVMTVKAALAHLGIIKGAVRPPLVDLTAEELDQLMRDLADGDVEGFAA